MEQQIIVSCLERVTDMAFKKNKWARSHENAYLILGLDMHFHNLRYKAAYIFIFKTIICSHGPHKIMWRAGIGPRALSLTHVV